MVPCDKDSVGERTAVCKSDGIWDVKKENCVLNEVNDLLDQSEVT